jgi:prophage regulatory protein
MPLPSDNFLRIRRVMERTGLSRATIYRKVRLETFPRSCRLGSSAVGWYESEIDAWIAAPR